MVSTNSSPPIALPMNVPPGHVVQQIVDENGTLRHVILSQHSAGLVPLSSHNPQHFGASSANGTNPPQQAFYQGIPAGFAPTHFHSIIHPAPSPTRLGHSPPPPQTHYKDERAQKQHNKLKKKIYDKQKKGDNILHRNELLNGLKRPTEDKGMDSVGTSEDGEESSIPDEEDSVQLIADVLSSVQAPKVSELSSRSALLQWAPPTKLSEVSSSDSQEIDISERDLRYEVLLSDKSKEMKFKSIYSGDSLSCRIQDLRPGQEYSVCLQAHLDELQGSATDPIKFTTPSCEPDQPQPPKLQQRLKNSLHLRWNSVNDNGSHISNYILEYDEGKGGGGGDFVEFHRSKGKQHILHKLQPGTAYRFRLAAVNDIGKSLYSDVVTYFTCNNPPLKPNPPVLAEASVNYLHVKWERRPTDDDYVLQMNDPKIKYYLPVYNGRDTSYVCRDLLNYTEYRFRLRAENDGGPSPWSDEVVFRTLPDRPSRPSKPIVKGRIHAHSFKLKWEPPIDTGGANITEYVLEVNSGSGYRTVYTGSDTEAVCDKLTPGTTYQLRVCCSSAGGVSNYSDPCTVTTDAISPGQCPQPKLIGKPKSNSISLKWSEPDYNGGAPVLEYEVELTEPDTNNKQIIHKNKQLECTATNLKPGCLYIFNVRAVNRIGPGLWSEPLKVTSGPAPPNTPEPPYLINKSPFHVYVEWNVPHSNGANILEYNLQISSLDDNDDNFHTIYQGSDTGHDVKGLNPFTAYYFRVQACNIAGCSPFSLKSATVTPAAPPATVTTLHSQVTPTTIHLTWNEPSTNGSPITHYNIEIGDKIISTLDPITEYTFDKLEPNTLYRIKIQAVNSVGVGNYSSTLKVSTLRLPPQPPKLECAGTGSNYLKLKWGEGKNPDYIQYSLEMENFRSHDFQCIYKGTALTYKVNRLHEMTTYKFRINASNDAGIGDYSELYEFTTNIALPNPVKALKLIDSEQRNFTFEWIPSKNTFTDPILYQLQLCDNLKQEFKEVYRGFDNKATIESLEAGKEYSARVCPIRVVSATEEHLQGAFSPVLNFSTGTVDASTSASSSSLMSSPSSSLSAISSSKQSSNTSFSLSTTTHQSHNKKSQKLFNSNKLHILRTKAISHPPMFYAVLITIIGIVLAMVITSFLKV